MYMTLMQRYTPQSSMYKTPIRCADWRTAVICIVINNTLCKARVTFVVPRSWYVWFQEVCIIKSELGNRTWIKIGWFAKHEICQQIECPPSQYSSSIWRITRCSLSCFDSMLSLKHLGIIGLRRASWTLIFLYSWSAIYCRLTTSVPVKNHILACLSADDTVRKALQIC